MRLRTILFVALFFVAALPGLSAIFLRVYENTLVRQTEAELVAQGAALAAMAEATWPGAAGEPPPASPDARDAYRNRPHDYQPETTQIDLSTTRVWPERPAAVPAGAAQRLSGRHPHDRRDHGVVELSVPAPDHSADLRQRDRGLCPLRAA